MSPSDSYDRLRSLFGIGDHISATTTRNGKIIGVAESHGRGRAASGDMDDSGHISISVAGTSPRGEEGALEACRRLVTHLNSIGECWGSPLEERGVKYIDATASGNGSFSGQKLTIQIVRASTDSDFWQQLGHNGNNKVSLSLAEAAQLLKSAVQSKLKKIPLEHRSHLTLALDACDVPGLALDAVVEEFNLRHGGWVESHGFHRVWVVGPQHEMVNQLCRAKA
jgi:hypothetical protein